MCSTQCPGPDHPVPFLYCDTCPPEEISPRWTSQLPSRCCFCHDIGALRRREVVGQRSTAPAMGPGESKPFAISFPRCSRADEWTPAARKGGIGHRLRCPCRCRRLVGGDRGDALTWGNCSASTMTGMKEDHRSMRTRPRRGKDRDHRTHKRNEAVHQPARQRTSANFEPVAAESCSEIGQNRAAHVSIIVAILVPPCPRKYRNT